MKKSDAIRSVTAAEYAPGKTFLVEGYEYPLKGAMGQILAAPIALSRGETWRVEYRVSEGASAFHPEMAKPLTIIPDDQKHFVEKARLALEDLATRDGVHADARLIAIRFLENWPKILGEPFLLRSEDGDGCRIKFFGWGEASAPKGTVPSETIFAPPALGRGISRPLGINGGEYSDGSKDSALGTGDDGIASGGNSGVPGAGGVSGSGGQGAGGFGSGTIFVESRRNWLQWFIALLVLIVLLIFLLSRPGCGVIGNGNRIAGPGGQTPGRSNGSVAPDSAGGAEFNPRSGESASPADSVKSHDGGSGSVDSGWTRPSDPDTKADLRDGYSPPENEDDASSGSPEDSELGAREELDPVGPRSSEEAPREPSSNGPGGQPSVPSSEPPITRSDSSAGRSPSETPKPSGSATGQALNKESSTTPGKTGVAPSDGISDKSEDAPPLDESRRPDEEGREELSKGSGAKHGDAESGASGAEGLSNEGHEAGSTSGPGEGGQSKGSNEGSELGSSAVQTSDADDVDVHPTESGRTAPTGHTLDGGDNVSEPLQDPKSGKTQDGSGEIDHAQVEDGSRRPGREPVGGLGGESFPKTTGGEDGGSEGLIQSGDESSGKSTAAEGSDEGLESSASPVDPGEPAGGTGDMVAGEQASGGPPQADEMELPSNPDSHGDQERWSPASGDSESEPGLPANDEPAEEGDGSSSTLHPAEGSNENSDKVDPRDLSEEKSASGYSGAPSIEENSVSPDFGGAEEGSPVDPGVPEKQEEKPNRPDNSLNELIEKARVLGGLAPPLEFVWRIEKTSRALENGANLADIVGLQPADPRSNKALPVAVDYRLIIRGKDGDDYNAGIVRVRYESE